MQQHLFFTKNDKIDLIDGINDIGCGTNQLHVSMNKMETNLTSRINKHTNWRTALITALLILAITLFKIA